MNQLKAVYKQYVDHGNRLIFRALKDGDRKLTAKENAGIAYYEAAAHSLTQYID